MGIICVSANFSARVSIPVAPLLIISVVFGGTCFVKSKFFMLREPAIKSFIILDSIVSFAQKSLLFFSIQKSAPTEVNTLKNTNSDCRHTKTNRIAIFDHKWLFYILLLGICVFIKFDSSITLNAFFYKQYIKN